jgi:hypothetical protein
MAVYDSCYTRRGRRGRGRKDRRAPLLALRHAGLSAPTHTPRAHAEHAQIVSARSALLSNVEVLALLRAADAAHVAQQRVKRADGPPTTYAAPGAVPDSLRTVELEVRRVYHFWGGAEGAQVGDPVPERAVPADGAADARGHHDARPRARAVRAHEGGEAAGREPRADRARRALRGALSSLLPLLTRTDASADCGRA